MLTKQITTFKQLRSEGRSETEIKGLYAKLKLFPTPFKGIYYVPSDDERSGFFIENSLRVLYRATNIFLGSNQFYFSCKTAEEEMGFDWHPSGVVHIVNLELSRKIDLKQRSSKNSLKSTWRAKKIAKLISFYGNKIIFHKVSSLNGVKTRQTPYGRFGLISQVRKDKKRFHEM